jgi:RimJ/RimL family protein N-acetyltransferase
MKYIVESERLKLREFTFDDAEFIVELLNTDGWLKFIGDRNVKSIEQACTYLKNGPIKSYTDNGFGLCMVERKADGKGIGMCGIIKRDTLENPDIGFAFLPEYTGKGYAFEIAKATLEYAKDILKISRVFAITVKGNTNSIRLLEKIGLNYLKIIKSQDGKEELILYGS